MSVVATSASHRAPDGAVLFLRRLAPATGPVRGTVVLVHGYCEHGGRYVHFAEWLAGHGYASLVPDLRGHGLSEGARGHLERFDDYLGDLRAIVAAERPAGPLFLFGHSLGGLIALLTAAAQPQLELCGLLLSNPYLANALPISWPKRLLGRVAARALPRLRAPSGLKSNMLSRDPKSRAALEADPLIFRHATAGWFREVGAAQGRAGAIAELACPLWVGLGTADEVALPAAGEALARRLRAPAVTVRRYEQALHELLQDTVAPKVRGDIQLELTARTPPVARAP